MEGGGHPTGCPLCFFVHNRCRVFIVSVWLPRLQLFTLRCMRYNIKKKLEKNMQTTERPPRPGDYRRRVKVNNAIRNGELHFYHAIEAFLEMHGPEDAELDAFRQEGLTEAQSVAAWVLGTVCLSAENMERAMQVWNASESHMANMKHNVPEFTLHDLREFSALFMARMWAATKQLKQDEQGAKPAKQPKP